MRAPHFLRDLLSGRVNSYLLCGNGASRPQGSGLCPDAQRRSEGKKRRKGECGGESAQGCGGRGEGERPTNGPGMLPRHGGRRERRFQKGRCSWEGSAAEARRNFGSLPTPGRVEGAEAASGGRGRRLRVLYFAFYSGSGVTSAPCVFLSFGKTAMMRRSFRT